MGRNGWGALMKAYSPLEPGRSIHCSWISTSPHSTFRNLRHMSWTIRPSFQTMQLSSDRQFCLLGCTLDTMVPLGRPSRCILKASRYGLMENSASPILSSLLNVSWSYTVWKCMRMISTYVNGKEREGNNLSSWEIMQSRNVKEDEGKILRGGMLSYYT